MGRVLPRRWLPAAAAVLLLFACSCVYSQETSAAAAATQMVSQAGCECLSTWFDAAGIERQGCANPDNDPMGDWCQVNPNTCLGYYGVYTSADDGDVKRKCRVDFATCPDNSTVGEFDYCDDAAAAEPLEDNSATTTFHNCDCKAGWIYTYADGTKGNFSACANPDGDPMGPWCAVDPATCDRFAGEINGQESNETLGYDYCSTMFRHPEPNSCAAVLSEYDQCGGKSKCSDYGCQDEAWPGACCPQGTKCYRQDLFYHQCLSPSSMQLLKEQQAAAAAAGVAFTGLKLDIAAPAQQHGQLRARSAASGAEEEVEGEVHLEDQASQLPSPAEDPSQIADSDSAQATSTDLDSAADSAKGKSTDPGSAADAAGSLEPRPPRADSGNDSRHSSNDLPAVAQPVPRQPTKVYTKLKIDMDYGKLMASPENAARFKSDVVTWLKASAGDQQYVQDTGVISIMCGSVIALAYIEFRPDTPADQIDLATSHLRTNAEGLYSTSGLPSAWGGLVSYLVSLDAAALDAAAMEAVPAPHPKSGKLSSGAIAGIAVALVCAAVLSVYVVRRTLGARRCQELAGSMAAKFDDIPHQQLDEAKDLDLGGSNHGSAGSRSTCSSHDRADGSTHSSHGRADGSNYSTQAPANGSAYSSDDSYGASPTKSGGFGQVRTWSERSKSTSAEEEAFVKEVLVVDEAEPISLIVPGVAAANLGTAAVHGSTPAGSSQVMAARAATPDAAFLPDECDNAFDEEELDLSRNPVGLLRSLYGQGRNSATGTPGGRRNNGGSYAGSVSSYHSINSRPGSGAGAAGAELKQRRISSASKDSSSSGGREEAQPSSGMAGQGLL
ncbi:hypothetical protein COO60DRAFT_1700160 [Scenedesmus sp. NREL 46B-D3]|nr:hypothetical protein COO60DRAFT_1700160 [Scenedesmus sp. NREL 46B-D3]